MEDLRNRVLGTGDIQGKLKDLAGKIPGFGGYLTKDSRRDADKLLREHLARKLEAERKRLRDVATKVGPTNLQLVGRIDKSVTRLQTVTDKIKTASYGMASFFDAARVGEKQLDALYTYDNSMLEGVPPLTAAIGDLAKAVKIKPPATDSIDEALDAVSAAVDQLATAWNLRQDVILQAG